MSMRPFSSKTEQRYSYVIRQYFIHYCRTNMVYLDVTLTVGEK